MAARDGEERWEDSRQGSTPEVPHTDGPVLLRERLFSAR
jgi:hypothetical protein